MTVSRTADAKDTALNRTRQERPSAETSPPRARGVSRWVPTQLAARDSGPTAGGSLGLSPPATPSVAPLVMTPSERQALLATFDKSVDSDHSDDSSWELDAPGASEAELLLSVNSDDPFSRENDVGRLPRSDFSLDEQGRPFGLTGPRVTVSDDATIYREVNGRFMPFANNPWLPAKPNDEGHFVYPDEARFPIHRIVRDASGSPQLDKVGLQQWLPREEFTSQTIAFDAANAAYHAVEKWAGRALPWGIDGQLPVNAHAFVGFNAFFSPAARALFFGVIPYRLPGEREVKMFEMASSWEVGVHEAGHALHHELKPNHELRDQGYGEWGESFGDQLAMWVGLQDPKRVAQLLQETRGNLLRSNAVTALAEAYASLFGEGTGLRDAYHNKTVSQTSDEVHDRSQVLTGAAYKVFLMVYKDFVDGESMAPPDAVREAAKIMGQFLTLSTVFTPENTMSLEDVAKAYLKVDKEVFGEKYHAHLVSEFIERELFRAQPDEAASGASSLDEWLAHEAAIPELALGETKDDAAVAQLVADNLQALGIGPQFGLTVQSRTKDAYGHDIVRVELTYGRGPGAQPMANHGVLVFRADGSLADYQPAMPRGLSDEDAVRLIEEARQAWAPQVGKIGFVKRGQAPWSVQIVTPKIEDGNALNAYIEVRDLATPEGRREEYEFSHEDPLRDYQRLHGTLPSGAQILI